MHYIPVLKHNYFKNMTIKKKKEWEIWLLKILQMLLLAGFKNYSFGN